MDAKTLEEIIRQIKETLFKTMPDRSEIIYAYAKANLGKNLAPIYGPRGCVEAVNFIVESAIGTPVCTGAGTWTMWQQLRTLSRFKEVSEPKRGDLIISPTGMGNGKIPSGHVGIFADKGRIMSNDSIKLKFLDNYSLKNWDSYFCRKGGHPKIYYRILS